MAYYNGGRRWAANPNSSSNNGGLMGNLFAGIGQGQAMKNDIEAYRQKSQIDVDADLQSFEGRIKRSIAGKMTDKELNPADFGISGEGADQTQEWRQKDMDYGTGSYTGQSSSKHETISEKKDKNKGSKDTPTEDDTETPDSEPPKPLELEAGPLGEDKAPDLGEDRPALEAGEPANALEAGNDHADRIAAMKEHAKNPGPEGDIARKWLEDRGHPYDYSPADNTPQQPAIEAGPATPAAEAPKMPEAPDADDNGTPDLVEAAVAATQEQEGVTPEDEHGTPTTPEAEISGGAEAAESGDEGDKFGSPYDRGVGKPKKRDFRRNAREDAMRRTTLDNPELKQLGETLDVAGKLKNPVGAAVHAVAEKIRGKHDGAEGAESTGTEDPTSSPSRPSQFEAQAEVPEARLPQDRVQPQGKGEGLMAMQAGRQVQANMEAVQPAAEAIKVAGVLQNPVGAAVHAIAGKIRGRRGNVEAGSQEGSPKFEEVGEPGSQAGPSEGK